MKVVSFSEHLYGGNVLSESFESPTVVLDAYKPYLLSNKQFDKLVKSPIVSLMQNTSEAWPLLRELHAEADGKGKHILLFNAVGGMGDNIMMWPLARILDKRGYKVHILVAAQHYKILWLGFPWIQSIIQLPAYWNVVQGFHAHVFFEYLTNQYAHRDQGHPLNIMLTKVGIDPESIPASEKRLAPEFTTLEKTIGNALYKGKRLAFFQLSASQHARSLAPEQSRNFLLELAKAFPELHWIGLYGPGISQAYYEPPLDVPNVEFRIFQKWRILWTLIKRAEICVGPDSMLVHAAGVFGVPCIGLWGLHDPQCRIGYYPRHFPIFLSEKCPKSPCYWPSDSMPNFCPDEMPDRTRCGVLQAITEDLLIAKVQEALSS